MNKTLSDQYDWDELLEFISEKTLTPIIGKEMYKFVDNNTLTPIDTYLSSQILLNNKVTDYTTASLTEAVNYLVIEKRVRQMDIIRKLKSIVKEINFDFPLLNQFLNIQELNYYINTAVYNNVLEKKIYEIRKQAPTSINFSINEPFTDSDNLDRLTEPFVFNVFGSLLNTVDPALSEDDMLEYASYFREKMNGVTNIINALKNKNLLFVGCAFPDWMTRFVLRLLSNEPLHDWGTKRTIIIVNDNSDFRQKQNEVLKNYDVVTYDGSTDDFVNELSRQWKQKNPNSTKTKSIFLSYTVKDKEAVEALKRNIESIGNITCWYDNRELMPGDDFKTEIAKNIKSADLFIPLISANSLMHKDGYVQLEWFTADNVNTFRKIDGNKEKYLMPVVIDDTNPYDTNVPKYFSELSIGKVPNGNPGQEFLQQIKETLNLI
ncbi:MAG: toll/interleukin-1 receptor domain-containing protein [Sphingobacteriales bacterium]